MASEHDRESLKRLANSGSVPTLKVPLIPEALKSDPILRRAWNDFDKRMDEWRKTLGGGFSQQSSIAGSGTTTTVIRTGGGQGNQGNIPVTPPPFVEEDLTSLYLMDWVM
jgi:hypothetical protein